MPQFVNILIENFSGGLTEDKRFGWVQNGSFFTTNKFSITKHFDVFTYPKKLVPYHKTENNETKAYDITKFLYAPATWLGAGEYRLYGLGKYTGSVSGVPYTLDIDDDLAGGWRNFGGGYTAGDHQRSEDVLFYYKDYIYWFQATQLCRLNTTSEACASYQTVNYTNVAQPVHHPADDCAYFFADNVIYKLNDTTWTTALTLPAQYKITAGCAYGNYLAVACSTLQTLDQQSVVFLWDRDSSLATLTDRIDFGEGEIRHLANLNNKLIAVMAFYLSSTFGLTRGKILIKQASGNYATLLNEITTDTTITATQTLPKTRMIIGNKLYFPARATLNSDTREGIWVVDEYGRMSLDFVEEEATSYEGIYKIGNAWFIAHSNDGSVNVSDLEVAFGHTSIYESPIWNGGDSDKTKKLIVTGVTFEKLPTAGRVVLKYRVDGATSWTTIFTYTTDSGISHEARNIESSGAEFSEFKELEFRIESTGGAVITGLKAKIEILDKNLE